MKQTFVVAAAALTLASLPLLVNAQQKTKSVTVKATITTSMGVIEVELDKAKAPITVENFISYAKAGHYDGTIFHRVIPKFMVQGGGMDASMKEKAAGAGIKNESNNGLRNLRGTLAMARTNNPESARAQFFINLIDNDYLDGQPGKPGYAVFGKVVKGMEVVDKIAAVKTASVNGMGDVPVTPVMMEKVVIQ